MTFNANLLEVSDLYFSYGENVVLNKLSFQIATGESILISGNNGSGKSTLLKTLVGELMPLHGKVYFQGENISDLPISQRVQMGINYCPQKKNVFTNLTVFDNLLISAGPSNRQINKDRIYRIVEELPILESLLKRRAGLLSGGQRQIVALAMVLVKKAKLIILDEPISGLSEKMALNVLTAITMFQKKENFSVLMVEHEIHNVLPYINRSFYLDDKCITELAARV